MADLPVDNDIRDSAVTEGAQKDNLEALRDVLAQMIGGGLNEKSLTISGGVITPETGQVKIAAESGAADILVTVQTTNLPDGSVLIIRPDSGDTITVQNGSGAGKIHTLSGSDEILNASLDRMVLILYGTDWYELHIFYDSLVARRTHLGLGDAAVMDQGAGNGLDADTLDTLEAAAFLLAAATAVDSDKLGGILAANYARKDVTGVEQIFASAVQAEAVISVDDTSTSTPHLRLEDSGVRRAVVMFDGADLVMQLYEVTGSTVTGKITISATEITYYDGSSTYNIFHDGRNNPINAADLVAGGIGQASVSGGAIGTYVQITMNRFSFFPSVECQGFNDMRAYEVVSPAFNPGAPKFSLYRVAPGSTGDSYNVSWEYIQ